MLRRARVGLGVLVLALSLSLSFWGYWPVRRETRLRPVSDPGGQGSLTLVYPPQTRVGEPAVVRLALQVENPGNATIDGVPEFYSTHKVVAEARFDIPEMNVRPSELISAPIEQGQTAVFYWTLRPNESGRQRGTIWLYLRTVDKRTGQESRTTVSAQILEIESVKLLGVDANQARLAGWVGTLLGIILAMPFFGSMIRRFRGKRT